MEYGFAAPVVVRITQGGNNTTERLTTRLWYNGQYQVVKRQDPAGLVWEWSYDGQGNLLWSKEPNGAITSYTYYPGTDHVWKVNGRAGLCVGVHLHGGVWRCERASKTLRGRGAICIS